MKTKYPRSQHFNFSPGTTSDDRISKTHDHLENVPIVTTEKLDGQNDAITKAGVYARSHAVTSQLPWDREVWNIHARIKNDLDDDTFIFGENMYAIHSIEYKKLTSFFYMFAVRYKDEWLSWENVKEYAYLLDLPTVPILFEGISTDLKTDVLDLIKLPSVLDGYDTITGEELKEGTVTRLQDAFVEDYPKGNYCFSNLLKYVRQGHVKTDQHWSRNWKKASIIYETD